MAGTVKLTFDIDDFSSVLVFAPYDVVTTQGSDFLVEVTVDAEDAHAIDIGKSHSTLIMDLKPGEYNLDTLEARVTMPRLDSFEIEGTANSTLSGFELGDLDIDIIGTGRILGRSMSVRHLDVRIIGTGGIDFGDIDPLQSVNVEFDGVIESTLNMDVESTLTGILLGLAKLSYWGTDVNLRVLTIGLSKIVQLGGTRNGNPADIFEINSGLNDAWFNPITSGQGFVIVVWEDIKTVFLSWYTFDTVRPPANASAILGEPGHRWLTAQGSYDGDTAVLDVYSSAGGVFDSAPPAVSSAEKVGDIKIVWVGCNEGSVEYHLPSLGLAGEIPIERIALGNVPWCEASR
jgi:hypothetical protein